MSGDLVWGNSGGSIEVELKPKINHEIILVDQEIALETPELCLVETGKEN